MKGQQVISNIWHALAINKLSCFIYIFSFFFVFPFTDLNIINFKSLEVLIPNEKEFAAIKMEKL